MKNRLLSILLVFCMMQCLLPATALATGKVTDSQKTLTMTSDTIYAVDGQDVGILVDIEYHWAKIAIEFMVSKGFMDGISDTEFAPALSTTRAMIATILWRMEGAPASSVGEVLFPDVIQGSYYAQAVAWAMDEGIIFGYENGTFGPENSITREELVAMLYRYAQSKGKGLVGEFMINMSQYKDLNQVAIWANEAFVWAKINQIIHGTTETTLSPKSPATRAQVATMLTAFIKTAGL